MVLDIIIIIIYIIIHTIIHRHHFKVKNLQKKVKNILPRPSFLLNLLIQQYHVITKYIFVGNGCQSTDKNCNSYATTLTNGHSGSHSSSSNNDVKPATPCTPGDPLTHYHHRNDDHYTAAFACMNRMRIHSQVSHVLIY